MNYSRIRLGEGLLFICLIICMTLVGCTSTKSSLLRTDEPLPAHLTNQPNPAWRIPLQAAEVEFASLVDENTLFMSTMNVTGFMQLWKLSEHEIVLADIKEGKILWRFPRTNLQSTFLDGAATSDCIVIIGVDKEIYGLRMTGLNRQSGELVWSAAAPPGNIFSIDRDHNQVIIAGPLENSVVVKAIDLTQGSTRWETSLGEQIKRRQSPFYDLHLLNDDVILLGSQAVRLRLSDGKVQSNVALDTGLENASLATMFDSKIFLIGDNTIGAFAFENGKKLWERVFQQGKIVTRILSKDGIFIAEGTKDGKYRIHSLNLSTGRSAWDVSVQKDVRSQIFLHNDRLYYTTGDTLYAISIRNGKELTHFKLPAFMHTQLGLPDKLTMEENSIVVAREVGIAAFDTRKKELAYAHAVQGGEIFTNQFASQRFLLRRIAMAGGEGLAANYAATTKELQRQMIRYNTGLEPQFAQNAPRTSTQAGFESAAAAANMASSIVAAGIAFRSLAVMENMDINKMQIIASQTNQALCIQHGYYVRPFYDNGWGVAIVRLSDGARADLYVSVPNEPLRINSGNFPIIFIDPVQQRILVNGIGLNPDPKETYNKVGFDKKVYSTWPGIPPNWIIPYASLFSYDLNDIAFQASKTKALPPAPPVLKEKERKLREAILNRDKDEVERLIKAGADVNAIDHLGFNSLFYAAILDDNDIAEILVDNGADATLRDPHGLLAYHYTFLTHADNRSTGIFRSANLKQKKANKTK